MSHAAENQDPVQCGRGFNLSSAAMLFFALFVSAALSACSGSKSSTPSNVGGGYTLKVAGGTLNDGSGANGLVVLATLRDKAGYGPGAAAGWTITITGPGFPAPLTVQYDDGLSFSFITWWWKGFNPLSGSYTARASNGSTTLSYTFSVNAGSDLQRPVLNKTSDTISWAAVSGAGSYFYKVTDSEGYLLDFGYLDSTETSFDLNSLLLDGSYLVEVMAHTKSRIELMSDPSSSPDLPAQENLGLSALDFVIGGTGSGYTMGVRGGVLYQGTDEFGTDNYSLVIWTSLLTTTNPQSPPAGDWTVTVTVSDNSTLMQYLYPRNSSHYLYWDFVTVPVGVQSYTVTAVSQSGTTTLSRTFTIPNPESQFPVATGLQVLPTSGGGGTATWSAVPGAASYYLNIWTFVGSVYTEVAGTWVTGGTTSAIIPQGTLTKGVEYDFYVTAAALDMTTSKTMPPPDPGTQVDMSDTTFTYDTFIAQ